MPEDRIGPGLGFLLFGRATYRSNGRLVGRGMELVTSLRHVASLQWCPTHPGLLLSDVSWAVDVGHDGLIARVWASCHMPLVSQSCWWSCCICYHHEGMGIGALTLWWCPFLRWS